MLSLHLLVETKDAVVVVCVVAERVVADCVVAVVTACRRAKIVLGRITEVFEAIIVLHHILIPRHDLRSGNTVDTA